MCFIYLKHNLNCIFFKVKVTHKNLSAEITPHGNQWIGLKSHIKLKATASTVG